MIFETLIVAPIYILIFMTIYRFRHTIKAMTDIERIISESFSDSLEQGKREFLIEKVRNGESISNSKTPWTEERLQKASDKVIDKLYE